MLLKVEEEEREYDGEENLCENDVGSQLKTKLRKDDSRHDHIENHVDITPIH